MQKNILENSLYKHFKVHLAFPCIATTILTVCIKFTVSQA